MDNFQNLSKEELIKLLHQSIAERRKAESERDEAKIECNKAKVELDKAKVECDNVKAELAKKTQTLFQIYKTSLIRVMKKSLMKLMS